MSTSTFETSTSTEKLDAALARAQAKIRTAAKDSANPFFKSTYADLASVVDACREALVENGISVTQWPVHADDARLHIVTRLACAGEWIRAEFSIPVAKADPQGFGAAITYARRYALAAAVGVVADEDDDGNRASGRGGGGRPEPVDDVRVEAAIADARDAIRDAPDEAALLKVGDWINRQPDAVKAAVREDYGARKRAVTPRRAKS